MSDAANVPKESPAVSLGVPEKQPRDLGVHKVVLSPRGHDDCPVNEKPKNVGLEAITIVQEDYCRSEKKEEERNRCVRHRIIVASILCMLFIGLEFLGGYFSNSLVIAADAAQLLTVFSTLMVSLFAIQLKDRKPHSPPLDLGWYRADVMAALISILITWVLTSIVLYLAFDRIVMGNFTINVDMMLATSAFAVVANLVMGMVLHNNCHVRYPPACNADEPSAVNVNVRSAFWHIVCDFLFSLAVFVTALFIDCCPDWFIVDPISTLVFSVFVLYITLAVLRDILNNLMEGVPKGIFLTDVVRTLLTIEGVLQVHDMRLWAVSLEKLALSAHLTIRPGVDHNEVLRVASRRMYAKYNFYEMTLHIESLDGGELEVPQNQALGKGDDVKK